MTRIKWLSLVNRAGATDYAKFSRLLSKHAYSDDYASGFLIDELRSDYLQARYVSKRVVKQNIETPFGDIIDQEFVSYDITQFRISKNGPGIELVNSPRSITAFLNQLALVANFQIGVNDLTVNLKEWVTNISENSGSDILMQSFECKDIQLGKNLVATLSVSGSGNIEKEIEGMLKDKRYTLKRVKLTIDGCNIVLSNNCSVQIGSGDVEHITELLRSSIPYS